jgi:hypothetical protein
MILKATVEKLHQAKTTLDLCAGYGQFTVRMIRALANYDPKFDVLKWLKENHTLIELQLESCYKLLCIFGTDINLFMGDALKIQEIRNPKGIKYYDGSWKDLKQEFVNGIMENEEKFIKKLKGKYKRPMIMTI